MNDLSHPAQAGLNNSSTPTTQLRAKGVITTGMMLFALFFGAGNLIFPPVLGASAGQNLTPVLLGFLLTGVLMPLIAIIAVSTSGEGVLGLAQRVGPRFGVAMPTAVYLAIGPLYAIPRVATVSYELATKPVLELMGVGAGRITLLLHALVFFAVTVYLAVAPAKLSHRIGHYLTPALLGLIAVLCVAVLARVKTVGGPALEDFATAPVTTGLTQGYFTMDVLAASVFGTVVISSVREQGFSRKPEMVRATGGAAVISALLLGLVYLGLAALGARVQGDPSDGAALLRSAASQSLGTWGTLIFAGIVLLACLTTAVGLMAAWAGYGVTLYKGISFSRHVLVATLVSFALANLGLALILRIVSPMTLLLYPITITLLAVTLLDSFAPGNLRLSYVGPTATAAVLGAVSALEDTGVTWPNDVLASTGLWNPATGWVLPTLLVALVCLALDVRAKRWFASAVPSTADVAQ